MPRRNPITAKLKADPKVMEWHANMARGSRITADTYIRRLAAFWEQTGTGPHDLLNMGEQEQHRLILKFITGEEKRNCAGSYIDSSVKAVRSWLIHNGIRITRPIKISGAHDTPTLADEKTPDQVELAKVFRSAIDPRDRVACALMAHSGVRPEVLGDFYGTDGLRVRDLPEMKVEGGTVEFEQIPTLVIVRKELSKAGHKYVTFLSEEGCGYLKEYLESRVRGGEVLNPESGIIHEKRKMKTGRVFVTTIRTSTGVKSAIVRAGFNWRPYVLRAYFDTQLLIAENRGRVAHDFRVFWMGHKGSMEARYTTNKSRLSKELLEEMRTAYSRCQEYLSTIPTKEANEEIIANRKSMLRLAKFTEGELSKMDLVSMTPAEFERLINEKLGGGRNGSVGSGTGPPPAPAVILPWHGPSTARALRLVKIEEIQPLLDQEWGIVKLSETHAVMSPPTHG